MEDKNYAELLLTLRSSGDRDVEKCINNQQVKEKNYSENFDAGQNSISSKKSGGFGEAKTLYDTASQLNQNINVKISKTSRDFGIIVNLHAKKSNFKSSPANSAADYIQTSSVCGSDSSDKDDDIKPTMYPDILASKPYSLPMQMKQFAHQAKLQQQRSDLIQENGHSLDQKVDYAKLSDHSKQDLTVLQHMQSKEYQPEHQQAGEKIDADNSSSGFASTFQSANGFRNSPTYANSLNYHNLVKPSIIQRRMGDNSSISGAGMQFPQLDTNLSTNDNNGDANAYQRNVMHPNYSLAESQSTTSADLSPSNSSILSSNSMYNANHAMILDHLKHNSKVAEASAYNHLNNLNVHPLMNQNNMHSMMLRMASQGENNSDAKSNQSNVNNSFGAAANPMYNSYLMNQHNMQIVDAMNRSMQVMMSNSKSNDDVTQALKMSNLDDSKAANFSQDQYYNNPGIGDMVNRLPMFLPTNYPYMNASQNKFNPTFNFPTASLLQSHESVLANQQMLSMFMNSMPADALQSMMNQNSSESNYYLENMSKMFGSQFSASSNPNLASVQLLPNNELVMELRNKLEKKLRNRGKYRCKRCFELKANHICKVSLNDNNISTKSIQVTSILANRAEDSPYSKDNTLTVNSARKTIQSSSSDDASNDADNWTEDAEEDVVGKVKVVDAKTESLKEHDSEVNSIYKINTDKAFEESKIASPNMSSNVIKPMNNDSISKKRQFNDLSNGPESSYTVNKAPGSFLPQI